MCSTGDGMCGGECAVHEECGECLVFELMWEMKWRKV